MVKLVRGFRVTGEWPIVENSLKAQKALFEKKDPQVKSFSVWGGITGRIDMIYLELTFDSLADEEDWSTKVIQDPEYTEHGEGLWSNVSDFTDSLYRKFEG